MSLDKGIIFAILKSMKRINLRSKKILLIIGAIITLTGIGAVSALTSSNSTSATEETPLVKDVRHQGEVLDNHEARITNNENDVSELQKNTGTAPSTTRVEIPVPSPYPGTEQPEPTPAPTPPAAPIIVSRYEIIDLGGGNVDCKLTYSNGTNYQWHWQTVNPQGAWVTDGQGQNGHWQVATNTSGICDQRTIGQPKVN